MPFDFENDKIPQPLINKIISTTLVRVGMYNWVHHKFVENDCFSPNEASYRAIAKEAASFGFEESEVGDLVSKSLEGINTDTVTTIVQTLNLSGNDELHVLSVVHFQEENGASTEMVYLGLQKFYILSSSRSGLLPKDIIKARKLPLSINENWDFDIYRDNYEKPFIPKEHSQINKRECWFRTSPITGITIKSSSIFFNIVDGISDFGGNIKQIDNTENASRNFLALIKTVEKKVAELQIESKDRPSLFPSYNDLLEKSKLLGIKSFLLNTLIEHEESRKPKEYIFCETDWQYIDFLSEEDAIKLKIRLDKELNEILKKIKRRKVALFFDAPGIISPEDNKLLENITEQLDGIAENTNPNICMLYTKGQAQAKISEALSDNKPRPYHNLKTGIKLGVILIIVVFIAASWIISSKSSAIVVEAIEKAEQMIENDEFREAEKIVNMSIENYRPGYLRFTTNSRIENFNDNFNKKLLYYLIEQDSLINAMIAANHNRIDDFTWEQIKACLELCPEGAKFNSVRILLNDKKDKYIRQ